MDTEEVGKEAISLWKRYMVKEVRALDRNIFIFKFYSPETMGVVLKKGPWNVLKCHLNLKLYDPSIQLQDHKCHQEWNVQFQHLLLEHHSLSVVNDAITDLGEKICTDPKNCKPDYGSTITTRVKIDLSKPLHRGGWWNTAAGGVAWVRYHWERQSHNLCHNCYTIDHNDEECENVADDLRVRGYTNDGYISYFHELAKAYGVDIIEDLDLLL